MKTHKYIAIVLSYLTLSPLLLILDGKWKLLSKWLRITLFILSPFMLVAGGIIVWFGVCWYQSYYYPKHHFVKPSVIENITGVKLPNYKVIEYDMGEEQSNGYYPQKYVLEFKNIPSEEFYQELDKKFYKTLNSNGYIEYSFNDICNCLPHLHSECADADCGFHIKITKDSKVFYIYINSRIW